MLTQDVARAAHGCKATAAVTHKWSSHAALAMYEKEMDFVTHYTIPVRRYVLATMPRSGSTLCSIRLWQSGQLGAPLEYLNFRLAKTFLGRLGYTLGEGGLPRDSTQLWGYWKTLQQLRTSCNGVFGCKAFISNFMLLAKRYPEFLSRLVPTHVVYLTRKDLVGQAISYYRAQRSHAWFGGIRAVRSPIYDFECIQKCLVSICTQMAMWERMFERWGVTPLRVHYEDVCRRPREVVAAVRSHLGVTHDPSAKLAMPLLIRQADNITDEWRARFLSDCSHSKSAETASSSREF